MGSFLEIIFGWKSLKEWGKWLGEEKFAFSSHLQVSAQFLFWELIVSSFFCYWKSTYGYESKVNLLLSLIVCWLDLVDVVVALARLKSSYLVDYIISNSWMVARLCCLIERGLDKTPHQPTSHLIYYIQTPKRIKNDLILQNPAQSAFEVSTPYDASQNNAFAAWWVFGNSLTDRPWKFCTEPFLNGYSFSKLVF